MIGVNAEMLRIWICAEQLRAYRPPLAQSIQHLAKALDQIATSYPRLLGVEGRDLRVTDLDADDGTPVIDLVAVFEETLPRGPVTQPLRPSDMLKGYRRDAKER